MMTNQTPQSDFFDQATDEYMDYVRQYLEQAIPFATWLELTYNVSVDTLDNYKKG